MLIAIDLFNVKIINPKKTYAPRHIRSRRSKPSAHPFDLFSLLVGKLVGAILKPRKPMVTLPNDHIASEINKSQVKEEKILPLDTAVEYETMPLYR